ncbi:hypothetical protein X777_07129 [Ooceraea biroi]|uniref:Uncharacterized protein n=1 Tax=Ooceraea biroi TaxID=2015173 RepID=A0A026W9V7_OOCBI|nr:hypothetical protein X777_07129 [Ooceraea biroi]
MVLAYGRQFESNFWCAGFRRHGKQSSVAFVRRERARETTVSPRARRGRSRHEKGDGDVGGCFLHVNGVPHEEGEEEEEKEGKGGVVTLTWIGTEEDRSKCGLQCQLRYKYVSCEPKTSQLVPGTNVEDVNGKIYVPSTTRATSLRISSDHRERGTSNDNNSNAYSAPWPTKDVYYNHANVSLQPSSC